MDTCKYCDDANDKGLCPIFDLNCAGCRLRYLLSEPCKILRQYMAEDMSRRFTVPDWKVKPHCECKVHCQRHTVNQQARYKPVAY